MSHRQTEQKITNKQALVSERNIKNKEVQRNSSISKSPPFPVYAKPRLSQVNVRQNLSATGRNFGFVGHNNK